MAYFAPELTLIGSASEVVKGQYILSGILYDHFNKEECLPPNDTCPPELASSTEW